MVDCGIVSTLNKALAHVKVYDRVLGSVYKYSGYSYNFELARDVLVALDNIFNVGQILVEHLSLQMNPFAPVFDLECIDQLRHIYSILKDNAQKEEVKAWKQVRNMEIFSFFNLFSF